MKCLLACPSLARNDDDNDEEDASGRALYCGARRMGVWTGGADATSCVSDTRAPCCTGSDGLISIAYRYLAE